MRGSDMSLAAQKQLATLFTREAGRVQHVCICVCQPNAGKPLEKLLNFPRQSRKLERARHDYIGFPLRCATEICDDLLTAQYADAVESEVDDGEQIADEQQNVVKQMVEYFFDKDDGLKQIQIALVQAKQRVLQEIKQHLDGVVPNISVETQESSRDAYVPLNSKWSLLPGK